MFQRVALVGLLVLISGVSRAQAVKPVSCVPCAQIPKKADPDTTLATFRKRTEASLVALRASRREVLAKLDALEKQVSGLPKTAPTDTSVTNELGRQKLHLAQIDSVLGNLVQIALMKDSLEKSAPKPKALGSKENPFYIGGNVNLNVNVTRPSDYRGYWSKNWGWWVGSAVLIGGGYVAYHNHVFSPEIRNTVIYGR